MRRRAIALVVVLGASLLLAGCVAPTPSPTPSATSTGLRIEQGITYSTKDGESLALDSCRPAAGSSLPVVVFVHGGSFTTGSRTVLLPQCRQAAVHGYAAFVLDYRLVRYVEGKHPVRYPGQLQDLDAAVRWLTADAQVARFGIDPKRMALLGESAGATLAAQLAVGTEGSTLPVGTFSGVVLLSGVYDFTAGDLTHDVKQIEQQYLGCAPPAGCPVALGASPIIKVDADDPPMLLINSTKELVPATQTTEFAAALAKAGVIHQVTIVPGDHHAIDIAIQSPDVADEIWTFLDKVTAR